MVPRVMVAFAVLALMLLANPDLLARLKDSIGNSLPAGAGPDAEPDHRPGRRVGQDGRSD
jgi:hypothetical protein